MIYDATLIIEGIELPASVQFSEEVKAPEGTVVHSCWGPRSAAKITAFALNDDADQLEVALSAQPTR